MSEPVNPLWIDVHSFARTLFDLVDRSGPTTPLERATRELTEAILVQSEDEVMLSASGYVGAPFLLRYVAHDILGPIRIVVDNYVVVDIGDARGHWLVGPRLLVPGQHIEAHGLRLFGRTVTPREALDAYVAYGTSGVADKLLPIVERAMCPKCGFLREADEQCYKCGAKE